MLFLTLRLAPAPPPTHTHCRFAQMMWRLNFLVTFVCLALNNSYVLYYICGMHTLFTVLVYAGEWKHHL